ncbi:hypothetical protein ACH5RR_013726 [Cinchona calisaya]|uniref:Phosphatidic acid phosphatase type 2/haloperoxidase domain-containing protein n=1 Tax=Cinchona calisaya TaxID=153742 RepID=A0ABD3A0Y3_9GENT
MSSVAAIFFVRPNIISSSTHPLQEPQLAQRIFRPRLQFYPTKSSYSCKDKKKLLSRPPNKMTEPTIIRAGSGDEGIRAFEQAALVDGSSSNPTANNGLEATLNNLSKWLGTVLFAIFLLLRHDAEAMWAALGSVLNVGLSTILKRLLNQERPVSNLRSDPGMPSSHAQSISYITIFAILSVVQWWGFNGLTAAISGIFLALGSYFTWLRVSQQLHTMSQVVVGALLGTIFSTLWFWSWDSIVLKAFESNLWVRIVIILGAAAFCIGFMLHVIRYWVMES